MELMPIPERQLRTNSGFLMMVMLILANIAMCVVFLFGCILGAADFAGLSALFILGSFAGWTIFSIMFAGLKIVRPNEARVFTLFGKYHGTITESGFHFVNPFCVSFSPTYNAEKKRVSQQLSASSNQQELRAAQQAVQSMSKSVSMKTQTLDNGRQKVNDVLGNPIIIGAVVIWRVAMPTQAVFSVENYRDYLSTQTDSTIRNVARLYPYDVFDEGEPDDGVQEKTLRGSALEIAQTMQAELQKRVSSAGLYIEEVRITHLAYAEEIAAAMLQRQQASAIIDARALIVKGAVSMVDQALRELSENDIVVLDNERKAAMVSNLLVVLCGNKDPQPIVNSGSLY